MINMAGLHQIRGYRSECIETSYEDFVRSSHNNPDKLVQKKTVLEIDGKSIGYNLPKKFISKLSMNMLLCRLYRTELICVDQRF